MKRVFSLFLCLLCVCAVTAQIRGNEIRVVVSPDHSDWVYRLNEKCTFTVRVLKAQNLLPDVKIDYELGPEMYPTEVKKDMVLKDGTLKLQGTMKTAGFLRCKVKAHVDGRTYEGLATSAYAPEQLQPVTKLPADFRDYWAKTLEEARKTPLNPLMTLLPERCTETDNVYQLPDKSLGRTFLRYSQYSQERREVSGFAACARCGCPPLCGRYVYGSWKGNYIGGGYPRHSRHDAAVCI